MGQKASGKRKSETVDKDRTVSRALTARAALHHVDLVLSRGDGLTLDQKAKEASDLWNILTALRGPDMPDSYPDNQISKRKATAPIRSCAFPLVAEIYDAGNGMLPATFARPGVQPQDVHTLSYHFNRHIELAIRSLGRIGLLKP